MTINDRLHALRQVMIEQGLDAYIINGTDPHMSEYVPNRWETRKWISGFTGSYGRVVITATEARLWTDSRYFIQAEKQLEGTSIEMMKDRHAETIPYEEWLSSTLEEGNVVGVDGTSIAIAEAQKLEVVLGAKGIRLNPTKDLLDDIWKDRPPVSDREIFEHPVEFAGKSRLEKIDTLRKMLLKEHADGTIISALDELAWLFNFRGTDINYNPVAVGYGFINQNNAILFLDEKKIPGQLKTAFQNDGISILPYSAFWSFLPTMDCARLYAATNSLSLAISEHIPKTTNLIDGISLCAILKSVKGKVEIDGMIAAHRRDGAAMVNFLYWLENNVGQGTVNELTVCDRLTELRAEQPQFKGESFHSIVGYAENGAVVHYSVTPHTAKIVWPKGFLLVDSGGQYSDGTTDITRTIPVGELTEQQRTDFTLVLKGMIQLTLAKFPAGTKGYQLDVLARQALWNYGLNYGHGTGHGVGHFLNVHEGPMSIRPDNNPEPLRAGQILSNEPGLYREGEYGIRTENMIVCVEGEETAYGKFLQFKTLTLCPIDTRAIVTDLLTEEEILWLNIYHEKVLTEVGPLLELPQRSFLKERCQPI